MSRKTRSFFTGYTFLALVIIAAVSVTTYLTWPESEPSRSYLAQAGDTWENVALRYGISVKDLLRANRLTQATRPIREGENLVVPPTGPTPAEVWQAHGFGMLAEAVGVAISLWLTKSAGLLPKRLRKGVLGLSLAIALISYATAQAATPEPLTYLSPQFIFACVKDGFTWSTSMPIIARAFGVSGKKR